MRGRYAMMGLIGIATWGVSAVTAQERKPSYMPKEGCVPDAKTAIRIAVAVWSPIYGEKHIESKKPFRARLHRGVWTVTGSLPKGWSGGVPEANIFKSDGRVLRVIHGK